MTITTKEERDAAAAAIEQDIGAEIKKEIDHNRIVSKYAGNRLPKVAPMEIDIGAVAKIPVKLIPATGPIKPPVPGNDRGAQDLIEQTKGTITKAYRYAEEEIDSMIDRLTKLKISLAKQRDDANAEASKLISKIAEGFKALDVMDAMIQELEKPEAEPTNAA